MNEVLDEVDILIDKFKKSEMVRNMIDNKEYLQNQNLLNYHIYYLNKNLNKLIDNKICKRNV